MRAFFTSGRGRLRARLALYGAAISLGLPAAFSQVLIGTVRQPTSPAPSPYEQIALWSDGLRLRAWLIGGSGERAAVVVAHGLGDSLESYEGLAATLQRRGHTVLLLDLRGHGGSEGSTTTLGGREREDVRAGLRAAAQETDVRAVVAEAPFDNYRASVAHHARLLYGLPPWFPLIPLSIKVAEWRAGFR